VKLALFTVTVLSVFCIYVWTSAPGLGLVDSGELTTTAWCLGIAHPTGYPLYTLLGHLWQSLLPMPVDRSMVLFSAAAAAVACGVLALVALHLFSAISISIRAAGLLSFIFVLGFALSSAAVGAIAFAEVYPLTVLIAALLMWLALRIDANGLGQTRYGLLLCYLWGLGLGNHLTIIWFFPVVLFGVLKAKSNLRDLVRSVACVALGASINLYLPIRSSVEPLLNWGHPDSIARLIRHLSAWQYQIWMFREGAGAFAVKFTYYMRSIPADVGWGLSLLALVGVVAEFKRKSWWSASLISSWIAGTVYNLNYSIPDISTYFLTFYIPLFVLAAIGFVFLAGIALRSVKKPTPRNGILLIASFVVPLSSIAVFPANAVQHSNRFARDFTAELLRTLPENALVIQADWDIQSPAIYLQNVERLRPDVVILDLNLMQRSWYVRQQARRRSSVFEGSESEVTNFLRAVEPFESGKPFQMQRLEATYVALNNGIIQRNLKKRPVYVRDAAASGHPGVGANFPYKGGAYFPRISSAAADDPILGAETFLRGRTFFSERERHLLYLAAMATAQQGSEAMATNDTFRVRAAMKTANLLSPYAPEALAFVKAAEAFGNVGGAPSP
jgi:hypothetical protein